MKLGFVWRQGLRLQFPLTRILSLPTCPTLLTFAAMIGFGSATAAFLMGAPLLGLRLGRFLADGSTMAADPGAIAPIVVNTNKAAALGASLQRWFPHSIGKPDLSMIINGILAGLVAITAPCAFVTLESATLLGIIVGTVITFSVVASNQLKIDAPVAAISVHLVNGIWGTLAVGLFADGSGRFHEAGEGSLKALLWSGDFTVALSTAVCLLLNAPIGIRVSPKEEIEGLDIGEHGMAAYTGFLFREEVKGFVDLLKRMSGSGCS
ncbi:hypothetical protein [uncultured Thermosynechococcus sp.]|uniref:ammonium transporter n=1 Tax=uncultured Thermosynechococcus sp. TaxID=436945 RepID=UPI0026295F78|nr:hypothetical protein [uncultured Thermosynechococcus sp.]